MQEYRSTHRRPAAGSAPATRAPARSSTSGRGAPHPERRVGVQRALHMVVKSTNWLFAHLVIAAAQTSLTVSINTNDGGRHVMAVLPAGSVAGINEELTVTEDLEKPNSPTVFESASGLKYVLTKSAEPQTPTNASALWVNGSATAVLNEGADLMGNALLHRGGGMEPNYAEIAPLAPPLLASELRCGDYSLTGQTFIGSRIAAEKRSFTPLGEMNNDDIRQRKHLDQSKLALNATFVGLLGDFTPAVRWYWPLVGDGWVEQTAFAVPESTEDQPFDVSSPQPIWIRYLNVSQNGTLRHAQYVNTFEQYPYYCRHNTTDTGALLPSPECDGQNAVAYYTSLLSFARYWNNTFTSEGSMQLDLPSDDIDPAAFAKHFHFGGINAAGSSIR